MTATESETQLRMVVVDDVRGHRDGLASAVRGTADLALVGSAGSIRELDAADLDGVAALVIQAGLPGIDVLVEVRLARSRLPCAVIVVLCGYVDEYTVARLTEHGATAVLSTDVPLAEVFELIVRRTPAGPEHRGRARVERAQALARALGITEREHEVLILLSEGTPPQRIARALGVSVDTVRAHLKGVRRKLDCVSAVELVVTAHRLGVLPNLARPLR